MKKCDTGETAGAGGGRRRATKRCGMASVMALLLVTVLMTLSVTFLSVTVVNLRQADNLTEIQEAQLQAESGLGFLRYQLDGLAVPSGTRGRDLMLVVATALGSRLNGSPNLDGGSIIHDPNGPDDPNDLNPLNDPNTITIPSIVTDADKSFQAVLSLSPDCDTKIHLLVTGISGLVSRSVGIDFRVYDSSSFFGEYGIASAGKVSMAGNAQISYANEPREANVLAGTYSDNEAAELTGNCKIEGDLALSSPDAYADLTGNISIGGEGLGGNIDDHIHVGVGAPRFPEVNPSAFEGFATNVLDSGTSTSGNVTLENIRIPANSNMTFSGNVTLKGVVFIEQPNDIKFTGNLNITGVIATQDAGEGNHGSCTIKFAGNTTVRGVDQLPDEAQYATLKQLPGAFLLAPGFGVEFTGNFGTVSGWMAADEFKWTGNASGTVHGGIISYADTEFKLTGNSRLTFDRSGTPEVPPGFTSQSKLLLQPETYVER